MDSLLPVHFIMKHCAFNNPFPALFYFPHWPHWWPLHDLLISHCDLESWFAMMLSSKTRYRDDFASMQWFAGALILKHQMRRAQLHKNQNWIHHNARSPNQLNTSTFSALHHQVPYHQVTRWAGSAHMPFILKLKLKFSLQRGRESTKTPGQLVTFSEQLKGQNYVAPMFGLKVEGLRQASFATLASLKH